MPHFQMARCIDPSKFTPGKELSFPCDGVDIWVVVRSQCTTKACGLVFNIHGGGMSDHATIDQATNMIELGSQADVDRERVHNDSSTGVGGILAGHCLPMSTGDTFVSCARPVDYDWGKEVIEFFKAHPLQ